MHKSSPSANMASHKTRTDINNQSMAVSVQKETGGKFNRSPLVFDEACNLPAMVQLTFRRISSKLWCDGKRLWQGSYPKLAQLCRVSVGTAYQALKLLIDAGLLTCKFLATGKKTGNTDTLEIHLSLSRLWKLNERYSKLTESQREAFCQQYAWKTLNELAMNLSLFERSQAHHLSNNERHLSNYESYLSNNERSQAHHLSNNERHLSNYESSNGLEDAPEADVEVPTDVDTDTNTTTDVVADSESTPTNDNMQERDVSSEQGESTNSSVLSDGFTEEGQAFYQLYCQQRYVVVKPAVNEKLVSECNTLGKHIKTDDQLEMLDTVARKQLPKGATNNFIYLKNLINALNAWKQAQEVPRSRSELPPPVQPLSAEEEEQRQARIAAIRARFEQDQQSRQGGMFAHG